MRVYPVLHVRSLEQALEQVEVARRHPVDGVFLIDHDADDARLITCIEHVHRLHPRLFLGANFIRRSAAEALDILAAPFSEGIPLDAIWADNAGVDLAGGDHAYRALQAARARTDWKGLHFGGIAFKYQTPVLDADLPRLAELARVFVDVPTTSGPGTGQAAAIGKLIAIRAGLDDHPVALASGVTVENIASFRGLVDHILVSTGINNDVDQIDEAKLDALLQGAAG